MNGALNDGAFNSADLVIVGFVLVSGVWAFARGLTRELLGIAGWVGAGAVTIYGFYSVRPYGRALIADETIADIATGIVLFLVALLLLTGLSGALSRSVRESDLGALDRLMGFVFGLARGSALICLGYLLVSYLVPARAVPVWLTAARTFPLIERGANILFALAPRDAREQAGRTVDQITRHAGEEAAGALGLTPMVEQIIKTEGITAPAPQAPANQAPANQTPVHPLPANPLPAVPAPAAPVASTPETPAAAATAPQGPSEKERQDLDAKIRQLQ